MHSHFRVMEIASASEISDARLLEFGLSGPRGNPKKMLTIKVENLNKSYKTRIRQIKERAKERREKKRKNVPPPLKVKASSPILSVEEGMRKLHGEAPSGKSKTKGKEIKVKGQVEPKKKEAGSQEPKAARGVTGEVPPARVSKAHRTESSCKTSRSEFVRKVLPANEPKLGYNFLYTAQGVSQLQLTPRQEDKAKKMIVTSKAQSSRGQQESKPVSKIGTICRTGSSSLPSPAEAQRLKLENEELNRRLKKLEENRTGNDLSVLTEAQRMTIAEQNRRIKVLEEKLAKPKTALSIPNSIPDRMTCLCLRCQSEFLTRSSFDLHLAVEHYLDHLAPETMFPGLTKYCLFVRCNATFDNRKTLVVHMQKQHDVINNYLGTVCGENDILREL